MVIFRVGRRITSMTAHILLGLILTPLVSQRLQSGVRTNPCVTSWWHTRLCDILGIQVTVSGYRPQPPALIVSNHVSWLDIIVLGGLTHTVFLSKREVRRWPVVGWLAARAGTLFISRGEGEAAAIKEQIADCLRRDGLLTLFPEGTTTDGREVRPFFSRLFAAAIETGTLVAPVALRYHIDGEYDPLAPYTGDQSLGENLRVLLRRRRTQVHVAFGTPIQLDGHSRREVARLAHDAVVEAMQARQPVDVIGRAGAG